MQEKDKKGKTTQDVTHRAHAAVAGGQCLTGHQGQYLSKTPKMWQLGKTNGVVIRLPRTKILGFQSGVPNSSDK